jgi:hypothetical protein
MEVAGQEVAYYQSKLEKAKELFALCERLLSGVESGVDNTAPRAKVIKIKAEVKLPSRQAVGSILNAVLPHMSAKGRKSAEIVKAAGITMERFNYFLLGYRKYVKATPSGQMPFKDYSLNKRGLAAKNRIKAEPIMSPGENVKRLISQKHMSLREISEKTGHCAATIVKYLKDMPLDVKVVPSDIREGWKMKAYKLA